MDTYLLTHSYLHALILLLMTILIWQVLTFWGLCWYIYVFHTTLGYHPSFHCATGFPSSQNTFVTVTVNTLMITSKFIWLLADLAGSCPCNCLSQQATCDIFSFIFIPIVTVAIISLGWSLFLYGWYYSWCSIICTNTVIISNFWFWPHGLLISI